MISQRWIEKTRATLEITKPGPERDALAAELAAAETANTDARAKHLRTTDDNRIVCVHCERWAHANGKPIVHANTCPERDNREAQPVLNTMLRLEKAERRQVDALVRG